MANILQVTPNLNMENRNILNPQDPRQNAANPAVHNPVDPTRVVRADGRDGEQTGNAGQQDLFRAVNYESNYGAFIKGLGEGGDLAAIMERLLYTDMAGLQGAERTEVGALVEKLLLSMRMDSPQELVDFLQGQGDVQARFTGDFFNQLRSIMAQNPSKSLWDSALYFLKGYNDYTSGAHLLQQMRSLLGDIEQLLLRSYREEFRELANLMDWQAENGETAQNTGVLNNSLIPFLASYVSATHDYGPVREAAMMLVFQAVRYQNGEKTNLEKLFDKLLKSGGFGKLFKGDTDEALDGLLKTGSRQIQRPTDGVSSWLAEIEGGKPQAQSAQRDFADGIANLLLKGANGQAGLENVQSFYSIMNGMLLNESVFMPLLHFLLPFQYEEKNVMSEMWVDPDAKREDGEDSGRKIKLFLKFDIQNLGRFELLMTMMSREAKMELMVPPTLASEDKKIQTEVSDILKRNGIRLNQIAVRKRVRDRRVDEVFPEIREKERTINVRI